MTRSELLYHGQWLAVSEGAFETITALESSRPQDLLIFTEADSGRTLWLRAANIAAISTGDFLDIWPKEEAESWVTALAAEPPASEQGWPSLIPRRRGDP